MSEGFCFRQFAVRHDHSTMPVGTDAVLLGAWCPTEASQTAERIRVLDIGTGSGVIALMLAQRMAQQVQTDDWLIDAIDIDLPSVEQAAANFAASPWADHLNAVHSRLQDLQGVYQRIVSNPPFFSNGLINPDPRRAIARQAGQSLSYSDLMTHAARLLAPDGRLAVIIPAWEEQRLTEAVADQPWRITDRCVVYSKQNTPPRRVMLSMICAETAHITTRTTQIVLMDEQGQRSQDYSRLTREYYL